LWSNKERSAVCIAASTRSNRPNPRFVPYAGLMLDPAFAAAFSAAKQLRAMEFRYVEETDQNRQALLEIYCAVVLDTPYNDFGTH